MAFLQSAPSAAFGSGASNTSGGLIYTPTVNGLARYSFEIPPELIGNDAIFDTNDLFYLSDRIDGGIFLNNPINNLWRLALSDENSELAYNVQVNRGIGLDFGITLNPEDFSSFLTAYKRTVTDNNALRTYRLSGSGEGLELGASGVSLSFEEEYEIFWSISTGTAANVSSADIGVRWFLKGAPFDVVTVVGAEEQRTVATVFLEYQRANFETFIGFDRDLRQSESQLLYGINFRIAGKEPLQVTLANHLNNIQKISSLKMLRRQAIHSLWRGAHP